MNPETNTDRSMPAFDIRDPLPTGTTLLEASAGTGKTWTIGALVTRYVAEEGVPLEQMLIVTFGRAASQELRERVRTQLVEAERALADPGSVTDPSDLVALLLDASDDELHRRRQRLRDALGAFDGATIATTHQFCHLVLRSLGVAGDTDSSATLVEDLEDLLGEVVDDLYLTRFGDHATPPFSHADALLLGRAAAGDPQARLEPADAGPETAPGLRVAFARGVRAELDRRKRRLGVLSYDDLLSQLAEALTEEEAPARERMRSRWQVVLVDEFQDTDPVQWKVLDRAFSGHATMVLIGDPKQAIYAFRGGDVTTYLLAAGTATTRKTLDVNWRSDSALLDSLQTVLRGAALGDDEIVVRDVQAHHEGSRLEGAGAPFRLRVLRKDALGVGADTRLSVQQIRPHVYDDVASDVKRLLTSGATFEGRALKPHDVAVIAFRNIDLQQVQRALAALGVPAVVAGSGSVFATPAASDWLRLLEALEQPHRSARVRSAALTPFFGLSALELDEQGDAVTDRVAGTVRDWAGLFASRGVAAVLEAAVISGLTARVLSRVDGERLLTDLRHIGQSLHQAATDHRLGLVALLTLLREQMADDKVEVSGERTRRLDSDAAAVQLVTIHGSKGLEYPVVYLPTLWDRFPPEPAVPRFHSDRAEGAGRCVDVGAGGPDWSRNLARAREEDDGESLRLLYVAMTRARSQVVAWWAPAPRNAPASPLHRMLFGRAPGELQVPREQPVPSEDAVVDRLAAWRDEGGPAPEPSWLTDPGAEDLPMEEERLDVRRFTRWVDVTWRRTSYSALSAAGAEPVPASVGSEPEEPPKADESDQVVAVEAAIGDTTEPSPDAVVSPMAHLPVGATFGSLVHGVLEHADPQAADLRSEMITQIHEQLVRWPVAVDVDELADALILVCDTPLGPLAGNRTLRDIGARDRLCEMDFELPLAGGDVRDYPVRPVSLGDVAPLLRRHLPRGDPLVPYAEALSAPALGGQSLRGYLTGSVDVVLRVPQGDANRYLVVDYKTNWLGGLPGEGAGLTSDDYRPEALAAAMGHSDYPLQALLYAVVLHRFLRWRQPGYEPDVHLGGVLYLYLRGMCGPTTPSVGGRPCGVFAWRPPTALVEELSDLLDGAPAAVPR